MEDIQANIIELEFSIELNTQLADLQEVLNYYEKEEFPNNYSENEYFSFHNENSMSEAEIIKCANWVVTKQADIGTEDFERLKRRLIELKMIPKTKINLNIGYVKAKTRYNNLLAFKQLKNL
jgi:hypothetical protein